MRSADPISAAFLFGAIPRFKHAPARCSRVANERLISLSMKLWSLASVVTSARSVQRGGMDRDEQPDCGHRSDQRTAHEKAPNNLIVRRVWTGAPSPGHEISRLPPTWQRSASKNTAAHIKSRGLRAGIHK